MVVIDFSLQKTLDEKQRLKLLRKSVRINETLIELMGFKGEKMLINQEMGKIKPKDIRKAMEKHLEKKKKCSR